MIDPANQEELETRVREFIFDREASREALNDLIRNCEKARPIVARALIEEGTLISELRFENAQDFVQILEPGPSPVSENQNLEVRAKRSHWIVGLVGATAACLVIAFWGFWDRIEEEPVGNSANWSDDQYWDESVGWMRILDNEGKIFREVLVSDGKEISVGEGGARIDLDNGVIISVAGSAQIVVGLHLTTIQHGSIFVEVPDHLGLYAVETDEGRMVDLGSIFSLSVQPGQATEVTVLKGNGEALRNSPLDFASEPQEKGDGGAIRLITLEDMPKRSSRRLRGIPLKVPQSYRKTVDAAKPLFAWDFDEIVGKITIPDRLGSGPSGILKGDFQISDEGENGRFLLIGQDDSKGWLDSDRPWLKQDETPFTFELWARPDQFQWGHLFHLRATPKIDPVFLRPVKGVVAYFCLEFTHLSKFYIGGHWPAVRAAFRTPATEHATDTIPGGLNSQLISPMRYRPGRWHHIAARVGDRDFTLFINGEIVAHEAIDRPNTGGQELMIRLGRLFGKPGLTRQFIGAIDEVALYPQALSNEEIRRHFEIMTREQE